MRRVAMSFSFLQAPRCRIQTLASSWWGSFNSLSRSDGNSSGFKLLSCNASSGFEGGHKRRWVRLRTPITTETVGRNRSTLSSQTSSIGHEISAGTISKSTKLNIVKSEISKYQTIQFCDIQQNIAENEDFASLVTVIVFDIETTGFSREKDRIIEIALQDVLGGENSSFQTLVNPERYVPNPRVHGISTRMVNKSDVPRMKDVIPKLLQFVKSRQKPGGRVVLIAHNARCFDVPFLIKEFSRCSFEIPPDWLFLDTLPLAREVMKSAGSKLPAKVSLQALRQHYGIPLVGSAHRAMSDVNSLSLILQRLSSDLKLPVSGLVERSFRASA